MSEKTVVVLGGSHAGLHVAHYILKNEKNAKVILVSKNSHFYWNLASIRSIVPDALPQENILFPLTKALAQYPESRTELIIGTASAIDPKTNSTTVSLADGTTRSLTYDQLVLATGSRNASPNVPWKADGTYEELLSTLEATRAKVGAAKHMVVGGAGATGVELAGELGYAYGKEREVILLADGDAVLGGDSIASNAAAELIKLGVKIKYGSKIEGVTEEGGKTKVKLGNGEVVETDLYLPSFGLVTNSEYVPAEYKKEKGLVVVDDMFKVKGTENVWAVGDIVSVPRAAWLHTNKHAGGVGANVVAALQGKPAKAVGGLPFDIVAVSTGRSRAAGRLGAVKMFSFAFWMAKGRTLSVERMAGYIDGSVA